MYLLGSSTSTASSFVVTAASSIALKAKRSGYINTIARVNPFPTQFDTVLPPAFGYWEAQSFTVPGKYISVDFETELSFIEANILGSCSVNL